MARRLIWHLVEGDTDPLPVQYTNVDLAAFSAIVGNFTFSDGERSTVAAVITDSANGLFNFPRASIVAKLIEGDHKFEIQFTRAAGGTTFTLPEVEAAPITLRIRGQNG